MATQLELAVLTYDSYSMTDENRLPLQGWEADHDPAFNDSSWSGFGATVYTRGSEVVISFRGTDGNMDWVTANPQAASGAYSLQVAQSIRLVADVIAKYGEDNLAFTGHSLGGGLASLMAAFFDKDAVVFDPAPFANTALNRNLLGGIFVPGSLQLYYAEYVAHQSLTGEPVSVVFADYVDTFATGTESEQQSIYAARASNVTGTYLQDEVLAAMRVIFPTVMANGGLQPIPIGETTLNDGLNFGEAVKLHSMALLIAMMSSPDLRDASARLSTLLEQLLDEDLYGFDDDDAEAGIAMINRLLQDHLVNLAPSGDSALERFAEDLLRLGTSGTAAMEGLERGVIAANIEYHYGADQSDTTPFIETVESSIRFDTSRIETPGEGITRLLDSTADLVDEANQVKARDAAEGADLWTVQSGAGSLSTSGDARNEVQIGSESLANYLRGAGGDDLLINGHGGGTLDGGSGNDVLLGGNGNDTLNGGVAAGGAAVDDDDYLSGGDGNDTLIGGIGNDQLVGGKDDDTYSFFFGDGFDRVYDSDGEGAIFIEGEQLEIGRQLADHLWQSVDERVNIVQPTSYNSGMVFIRDATSSLYIAIRDWEDGDLGISFEPKVGLETLASSSPLREGGASTLTATLLAPAHAGDIARISVNQLGNTLAIVTGVESLSLANGFVDVLLEEGQTQLNLALLSTGDVDANAQIGLTATLLDSELNPSGPAASLSIDFEAIDEATSAQPGDASPEVDASNGATELDADIAWSPAENEWVLAANYGEGQGLHSFTMQEPLLFRTNGGHDLIDFNLVPFLSTHPEVVVPTIVVEGGADNDRFNIYAPQLWLNGETGNDLIEGYGDVTMLGGAGSDLMFAGEAGVGADGVAGDRLFGEQEISQADAIAAGESMQGVALLGDLMASNALESADLMVGSNARDVLAGGGGGDTLISGAGDDLILGDIHLFLDIDQAMLIWSTMQWNWSTQVVTEPNGSLRYTYELTNTFEYFYGEGTITSSDNFVEEVWPAGADSVHAGSGADWVFVHGGDDFVDAGSGNDVVFGSLGNDTVLGSGGNDVLDGGSDNDYTGADFLDGGADDDQVFGGHAADVLYGGAGNDRLVGDQDDEHSGDDYLNGEDGIDLLEGGGGADTLIGGIGDDQLHGDYSNTANEFHGNDFLDGGTGADLLNGEGGSDTLIGGSGDDQLFGESSSTPDEVHGDDYLDGGEGDDLLVGNGGADILFGGDGSDSIDGDASNTDASLHADDYLDGGAGNDTLIGSGAHDTLLGGEGDDVLRGDADELATDAMGDDYLDGGEGQDQLFGDGGNDFLDGGADNDWLYGNDGADELIGGLGIDVLYGGAGDDTYVFNAGDFNVVNNQADYVSDAEGFNSIVIGGLSSAEVTARLVSGGLLEISRADRDVAVLVEGAFSGSLGSITLGDGTTMTAQELIGTRVQQSVYMSSTNENALLLGGAGRDELSAVGASSTLIGGRGSDDLEGGIGSTTYVFHSGDGVDLISDASMYTSSSGQSINTLSFGEGIVAADIGFEYLAGQNRFGITVGEESGVHFGTYSTSDVGGATRTIDRFRFADGSELTWEQLAATSRVTVYASGSLNFTGTNLGDDIVGSSNAETIAGGTGDDVIDGSKGNDILSGGAGSDTYVMRRGSGYDTIQNYDTAGGKTDALVFDSSVAVADVGAYRVDNSLFLRVRLSSDRVLIENFFTNAGLDEIRFDDGTVWASAALAASLPITSIDNLTGTSGNDTFTVDNAFDTISESAGGGTDTVQSSVSYDLAANVEHLTLTGTASIEGVGNSLNNVITGNSAGNVLDGRAGVDILEGGAGDDTYVVDQVGSASYYDNNYRNFQDTVIEAADGGTDTILATTYSAILPDNVERLIVQNTITLPSPWTINNYYALFTGNALDNYIDATNAVVIFAGATSDVRIDGGVGADVMIGSTYEWANNVYVVDNIGDQVIELAEPTIGSFENGHLADWVESYIDYTLVDGVENLTLLGAATNGVGNAGNNGLWGNELDNILTGGDGDDRLDGGNGGMDTLRGGVGNDWYAVYDFEDFVVEAAGEGTDRVYVDISNWQAIYVAPENIEEVQLASSIGSVTGNVLANRLIGTSSNDTFDGQAGNDRLEGHGGNDHYVGFRAGSGADVISDASGNDVIEVAADSGLEIGDLQFSQVGDDLRIELTAADSVSVEDWFASAGNRIERLVLVQDGLSYAYTGAQLHARASSVNGAPSANATLEHADAGVGGEFSYDLPTNLFTDVESQSALVYSAQLANGDPLPAWLAFDPVARRFVGTPTAGSGGDLTVRVVATDAGGLQGSADFALSVYESTSFGTTANDTLSGDNGSNFLNGLGGDDTLNGLGGIDVLIGSDGNDSLDGGSGADRMTGGAGDDTYYVDETGDLVVDSAGGLDTVNSMIDYALGAGIENLVLAGSAFSGRGNELDNVITGNAVFNRLYGEGGNDRLEGVGNDEMYGGVGDDTYVVDDAADELFEEAGEGRDTIESYIGLTLATNFEDLLLLGSSAINATGNSADNTLIGNDANNILRGNGGADTLRGEGGDDTYVVDALDTLLEQANEGTDTVQAGFSYTLQQNFERLTLTGSSSINGTGNSAANVLTGNSGANVLDGGTGGDSMSGGSGNDTYYVDHSGDTVSDSSSTGGTDRVFSSVTFTLGSNVEHLTLTGTGNINGTGNSLANQITGNAGNNTLSGGTGADTLTGGAGNDTYVVDNAGDVIVEGTGEGTDLVQASISFALGANFENLTLTGTNVINGTGNELDNVLIGNGQINTLMGGAGNDTLNGGSGNDTMIGGAGNDTYVVAQSADVINEIAGEGIDSVQATATYTLSSEVENLTLTSGAISGTGNALDNVLIGNSSSNTLTGNGGNDRLDPGSGGTDVLAGGQGNDTYVIGRSSGITINEAAGAGTDTVEASVTFTLNTTAGANIENLTLTTSSAINGTGNALANVISGNAGNNTLTGNAGNDTLTGGNGADIYSYSSGHGTDTINNASTDSAQDRLNVTNLTRSQVTFTQSANDLVMTRNGTPTDSVRVTDWFAIAGNQLDFVQFTDQTLTAAQINAMFGSGLMAAPTSSAASVAAPETDTLNSAALQFIDAMNHFGDKRRNHLIDSESKDYRAYEDEELAASFHHSARSAYFERKMQWREFRARL